MFSLIKNWRKYRNVKVKVSPDQHELKIIKVRDSLLQLDDDCEVQVSVLKNDLIICHFGIFGTYTWNGADIPLVARWLMGNPTDKEWGPCSMAHDFIISSNLLSDNHYLESKVLLEILKREKHVPTWKEYLAFTGVYLWSIYTAKK